MPRKFYNTYLAHAGKKYIKVKKNEVKFISDIFLKTLFVNPKINQRGKRDMLVKILPQTLFLISPFFSFSFKNPDLL